MMVKEAGRVSNDPRNGAMRHLLHALREGWAAFQEELALRLLKRSVAAKRQAMIRAMTDDELMIVGIVFGDTACYPELRRRGLPVPGEVSHV